jgi:uncharacterized RDD family membrane protein YckC
MWKRISAALLDVIILVVLVEGLVLLLMTVFGFEDYTERKDALEEKYFAEYGIDRNMTAEDYNALSEEGKAAYRAKVEAANKAYQSDAEVSEVYSKLFSLALMIATLSILFSFLILEFTVPLLLKNGQTIGKKVFGVAVMRIDGVKVTPVMVFARGILGKCTVGTLVPIYLIMMVIFGIMNIVGVVAFGGLLLLQAILFFGTRNHTPIHDLFAQTITVDMASQLIFDSPEDMLAYKKRISEENAENAKY